MGSHVNSIARPRFVWWVAGGGRILSGRDNVADPVGGVLLPGARRRARAERGRGIGERGFAPVLVILAYMMGSEPVRAQCGHTIAAISSRNAGTLYTVDHLELAGGDYVGTGELASEMANNKTFSGISVNDLGIDGLGDYLLIVHPLGGLLDELQHFDLGPDGLALRGTLLSYDPQMTQLLAVSAGFLDGDGTPDVLTIEFFNGDDKPRLWHYEVVGGSLSARTEIVVPAPSSGNLVAMTFGDWDGVGGVDMIIVENGGGLTFVNHYVFGSGTLVFEETLLERDGWLHNFRSVSIGDVDQDGNRDLTLVDKIFHDSATTIEWWDPGPSELQLEGFLLITIPAPQRLVAAALLPSSVPTGACLLVDGVCVETTQLCCEGLPDGDSEYQGNGSVCDPPPPIPTMSQWGGAITTLMLLTMGTILFGVRVERGDHGVTREGSQGRCRRGASD